MIIIDNMSIFFSPSSAHKHTDTHLFSLPFPPTECLLLGDSFLSVVEMMDSWGSCQDKSKTEELFKISFLKVTH